MRGRGLVGLLLAGGLLAGCGGGSSDRAERSARSEANNEIAAGIEADLTERFPELTRVDVDWADDASNDAVVGADLICTGCDQQAVGLATAGLVWRSAITPLRGITVLVGDPEAGQSSTDFSLPQDEAELVRRFGDRPAAASADSS